MTTVPAVSNIDRMVDYAPVAPTTTFNVTWPVVADSEAAARADLVVMINGISTSGFTFTGNPITGITGVWNGGTVTLDNAMSGGRVIIYSKRDPQRMGQFLENVAGPMPLLDSILNDLTIQLRDMHLGLKRSIKLPVEDIADDLSAELLSSSITRAGKFMAFDAEGQPSIAFGTGVDSALRSDIAAQTPAAGDALLTVKRDLIGSVALSLHSWIEAQVVNAKEFGATGDGVTDDYAALNAAFTRARSSNQVAVYVPRGTYLLSRTLNISNVSLIGAGGIATHFKRKTPFAGGSILRIDDTTGGSGSVMGRYERFRVDGNRSAGGPAVAGLWLEGVVLHNTFDTIQLHEMNGSCLVLNDTTSGRPSQNTFINIRNINSDSHGVDVRGGRNNDFIECLGEILGGDAFHIDGGRDLARYIGIIRPWVENVQGNAFLVGEVQGCEIRHPNVIGYGSAGSAKYGLLVDGRSNIGTKLVGGGFSKNERAHANSRHVRYAAGFNLTLEQVALEPGELQIVSLGGFVLSNGFNIATTSMENIHFSNGRGTVGVGSQAYFAPMTGGQSATEATIRTPVVGRLWLGQIRFMCPAAGGEETRTATVYKNGAATTLTATTAPGGGSATSRSPGVTLEDGDTWSVLFTGTRGAAACPQDSVHVVVAANR
jgi:hypothetical protein